MMNLQSKYFLIAVITIGSAGIWLPIGIELLVDKKVTFHNIPQNVTTYFVSLLFAGCIDYFLGKLNSINITGIANDFLNVVLIIIGGIILVIGAVVLNVYKYDKCSLLVGVTGMLISYKIWWIANIDNPNFTSSNASLGGDTNKPLSNG